MEALGLHRHNFPLLVGGAASPIAELCGKIVESGFVSILGSGVLNVFVQIWSSGSVNKSDAAEAVLDVSVEDVQSHY